MWSSMARLRRVAWLSILRVVRCCGVRKSCTCVLASVLVPATTYVLTAQAKTPSVELTPEYFRQKVDQRFATCVEVYYVPWSAFVESSLMTERALAADSWACRTSLKFPIVTPLAEELAGTKLEPLKRRPRDCRLSCVVTFNEGEKPVTISFSRVPLSVCLNGKPFKPSWRLLLRVSEFLPQGARKELLQSAREDWRDQGYGDVSEEDKKVENEEHPTTP